MDHNKIIKRLVNGAKKDRAQYTDTQAVRRVTYIREESDII